MSTKRRKWPWVTLLVLVTATLAVYLWMRPEAPDTRWNGAYRLDDGRLVFVTPREGDVLRYRMESGESRALWPAGERRYEAGAGWAGRDPVEVALEFAVDGAGRPTGFRWHHAEHGEQTAERLDLAERMVRFTSGELELRGKLVTPAGAGPHPVVVLVHGSGAESAVDTYYNPYLFAPYGIATFVYDKRGTGESEGDFSQNFHVLAGDVAAAVGWLRTQSEIDAESIHLAGYSQGGWIAPLAASRDLGVRSLLIGYGPMVPVTGEDRWGYVYALREKGMGDEEIAAADRVNDVLSAIVDRREDRWSELERMFAEAEDEPWMRGVAGSDSMLGFLASTKMPWWMIRTYAWWVFSRPDVAFIDRLYDPVPAMASLEVPSLWIFGGEDHSMPTGWTVDELEALQGAGKPIQIRLFPDADHGILLFDETEEGERTFRGYAPGYLPLQVEWLRSQSGLEDN